MNKTIQTVEIIKVANTAVGVFEVDYNPDTNYDKIVGMVVFNKATHTNFDIGLRAHNGEQLLGIIDHEYYGQKLGERYFPFEKEIDSNKLKVVCSIREQQAANPLFVQVGFILETDPNKKK